MRKSIYAMVLTLALGSLMPSAALCQEPADVFDDEDLPAPPPPKRSFDRPRKSWKQNPYLQGALAIGLSLTIPFGIYKIVCQMRGWRAAQEREKAPWERAMEEAERARAK